MHKQCLLLKHVMLAYCQNAIKSHPSTIQKPCRHICVLFSTVQRCFAVQRRLSSAGRAPRQSKRPPDSDLPTVMDRHGNQMVQVEPGVTAPVDAVMMPMDAVMSGPGCLSMFNNAGTTSGKRFVRTSKPAAGSSLNVRVHALSCNVLKLHWQNPDCQSCLMQWRISYFEQIYVISRQPKVLSLQCSSSSTSYAVLPGHLLFPLVRQPKMGC